ncbi:MAG: PDZ domain-containing protein [Planctomycetota bacterium]|nr:PDZ domain-containing protein [Planctomycetota bacterium]
MQQWLILIALGSLAMRPMGSTIPPSKEQLELAVPRLLASDRGSEALEMIDSYLSIHPDDAQVLFDAAKVASRIGDSRGAAIYAIRSLRAGWVDDKALDEHPDFIRLRSHESWEQVRKIRSELRDNAKNQQESNDSPESNPSKKTTGSDAIARRSLQAWLGQFGGGRYRIEEKPSLNLILAYAVEPEGFRRTMKTIEKLSTTLSKTLFGEIQTESVLMVIATPADADKFLEDAQQGGLYVHEDRRLVSRDTGATLRHEYTHLRHYGQMQRLQQRHPVWIQEGLATLFEDWQLGPSGELMILPNLRTNDAFDRIRQKNSIPWVDFFQLDSKSFMAQAQWNYAQARSMLMYIASQGKLTSWYKIYTESWGTDPSGRRALEAAFGVPIGRIEAQWKAWVHDAGRQDSTIDPGDGVMGTTISNLPDGVRIDAVQPGGPAAKAGIRVGDVITDIGPTEIRSVGDYLLAMSERRSGENIKVRFRRSNLYSIVEVYLASGIATPP